MNIRYGLLTMIIVLGLFSRVDMTDARAQGISTCLAILPDSISTELPTGQNRDFIAQDTCSNSLTYLQYFSRLFNVHFRVDAFHLRRSLDSRIASSQKAATGSGSKAPLSKTVTSGSRRSPVTRRSVLRAFPATRHVLASLMMVYPRITIRSGLRRSAFMTKAEWTDTSGATRSIIIHSPES
jgi:hypothetical protein